MTSCRGFFLRIDIMIDIFSYTVVQCLRYRSSRGGWKQEEFFFTTFGSRRANRRGTRRSSQTLEESLPRNVRTNPNRDLGAHRAALCRCGNRRIVELES